MKQHKQVLLMILFLPVLVIGCGKGDNGPSGSGSQAVSANAVATQPSYKGTYFPQIEDNYGNFRVAYSFWENGCFTGRQRISGYDRESTRQQLCQRLQEDWPNRGCARGMRQAYFANMCSGIAWSPR
jgi:hypothetical protein